MVGMDRGGRYSSTRPLLMQIIKIFVDRSILPNYDLSCFLSLGIFDEGLPIDAWFLLCCLTLTNHR